jgi:hypothetical protein
VQVYPQVAEAPLPRQATCPFAGGAVLVQSSQLAPQRVASWTTQTPPQTIWPWSEQMTPPPPSTTGTPVAS